MNYYEIVTLAIVQGITEFLPVSSSAHLSLIAYFFEIKESGLDFDVALHIGSLFAIMIYFRKELFLMLSSFKEVLAKKETNGTKLLVNCIVATIPVLIAGLLISKFPIAFLKEPHVTGFALIVFGILLYFGDSKGKSTKNIENMTLKDAILIGLSQMIALIPGTSRSGITMTTARFLGFKRSEAARFSMIIAMPAIGAAGAYTLLKIIMGSSHILISQALIGVILSFVASYFAVWFLMKLVSKTSFLPFVIYRIIIGILVLVIAF